MTVKNMPQEFKRIDISSLKDNKKPNSYEKQRHDSFRKPRSEFIRQEFNERVLIASSEAEIADLAIRVSQKVKQFEMCVLRAYGKAKQAAVDAIIKFIDPLNGFLECKPVNITLEFEVRMTKDKNEVRIPLLRACFIAKSSSISTDLKIVDDLKVAPNSRALTETELLGISPDQGKKVEAEVKYVSE